MAIPRSLLTSFVLAVQVGLLCATCSIGSTGRPSASAAKIEWESPWTYACARNTIDGPACQRQAHNRTDGSARVPLAVCILNCGAYGALWPYPNGQVHLGNNLVAFQFSSLKIISVVSPTDSVRELVENAAQKAFKTIGKMVPVGTSQLHGASTDAEDTVVAVSVKVEDPAVKFRLGVNESYSLSVNYTAAPNGSVTVNVSINGHTYFGVRHALETLTQIVAFNEELCKLQILSSVSIEDQPFFQYRGLLLDTARNFYPLEYLIKLIDGMSYNKLNVFHWHLTDSNSFPFNSKRVPQVTRYGIVDATKVYTPEEITEFIAYANANGIKVIPELDAPSHAGNGWQWGSLEGLGELSLCVNAQPYKSYCIQPPCGQLNPLNNNTYFVLGELYKDLLNAFDHDLFHMGNDEISYACWLSDAGIQEWLSSHNGSQLLDLWGLFQEQALAKLKGATSEGNTTAIVWTSEMTNFGRKFLKPEDYIIQIWSTGNDSVIGDIIREGYHVIFSNNDTLYLDHGYGAWRGTQNKATLKSWQMIYGHDILSMVEGHIGNLETTKAFEKGQILGGEATLWSEKVDPHNMESRMWPRGAALAERLWSNPPANRTRFAYPRLIHHRERMVARGIEAEALLPEACYNIWGFCDDPDPTT